MAEKCKSCGQSIRWVRTRYGKMMPLDAEPHPEGNVVIQDGLAHVLEKEDLYSGMEEKYRPHFATCPHSPKNKNRRTKQ